jgi:asparagine N-glycosylation enzyme membrane subunit Stt3
VAEGRQDRPEAAKRMKTPAALWFARVLATLSAVWCVVVGFWIWFTPVASPLYSGNPPTLHTVYRSLSETSRFGALPLSLPAVVGFVGAWAAWGHRRFVLGAVAALLLVFSIVTGFSIGMAYMPAAAGFVWATAAALSVERSVKHSDT